jgi:hypothetical protein
MTALVAVEVDREEYARFGYVPSASQLVKPNVRDVGNGGLNWGRKPQLVNACLGVQQI